MLLKSSGPFPCHFYQTEQGFFNCGFFAHGIRDCWTSGPICKTHGSWIHRFHCTSNGGSTIVTSALLVVTCIHLSYPGQ